MTNKQQPFRRGPLLGLQQNKGRGQNVKMVLSKNHSSQHTYGNQANNNTKINIGLSFKDTEVKFCHSKVVPPNKISLSYP